MSAAARVYRRAGPSPAFLTAVKTSINTSITYYYYRVRYMQQSRIRIFLYTRVCRFLRQQ